MASISVTNRPEEASFSKNACSGGTSSPASMERWATVPRMVQVVSTKPTLPERSSRRTLTGHSPTVWNIGATSKDTPTSWASTRSAMNLSGVSSSSSPSTQATPRAAGAVVSAWRTMAIRGPSFPATSTTASPGCFQLIFPVSKHQRASPPSFMRAEAGGQLPVISHSVRGRT